MRDYPRLRSAGLSAREIAVLIGGYAIYGAIDFQALRVGWPGVAAGWGLTDAALERCLLVNVGVKSGHRAEPNWAGFHCARRRKHVTLAIP